jgi:hypothetical protein
MCVLELHILREMSRLVLALKEFPDEKAGRCADARMLFALDQLSLGALHPHTEVGCPGGTLVAKSIMIAWNDQVSHSSLSD